MTVPLVFLYSGQGAQTYQMCAEIFAQDECFRDVLSWLDRNLREESGRSVVEEIYSQKRKRNEWLDDLLYSHPAIFMIEYALTQLLAARDIRPDKVVGASVGEYCAAAAVGLLDPVQALKYLSRQAEILQNQNVTGGMLAVLSDRSLVDEHPTKFRELEVAADNYPGNFVVAGAEQHLSELEVFLRQSNLIHQRLPIPFGFHSQMFDSAWPEIAAHLPVWQAVPREVCMYSCATADRICMPNYDHHYKVMREPILVSDTIAVLEEQANDYLDLGPGGTFANLVKYNPRLNRRTSISAVMSAYAGDADRLSQFCGLREYGNDGR